MDRELISYKIDAIGLDTILLYDYNNTYGKEWSKHDYTLRTTKYQKVPIEMDNGKIRTIKAKYITYS